MDRPANRYAARFARLVFGLFLYAVGINLTIQAHVGLAPWDALSIGLTLHSSMSFGVASVVSGAVILGIDYALGEKIGCGTILNTVLIGVFVDCIRYVDVIPRMDNFYLGVVLLCLGQVIICLGTFFYIGSGLGCGPRDAFMVALGKLFPKVPIGMVRGLIEGTVLLAGWLLGAKMGIGTVISVFGIGFILQTTFRLLKFDVKAVRHESVVETLSCAV